MPRGIGASTGVIVSAVMPAACLISGTCRCAPTLYADRSPITSLPSRCGCAARPAPEVPLAETTRRRRPRRAPAAISGAAASIDRHGVAAGVGDPVGGAMRARWPGSSGRPYVQAGWCAPP